MARKLDFKTNNKMVTQVMKQSSEDLNNKKRDIELDKIVMNPDNEGIFGLEDIDYMAETIEEDGFAGAIEVYALDDGTYEISSGHRRYLASKKLGMKTIPAIVSENVDDKTKSKKLIKSNILNRKLTALKTAKALDYYREKVLYDYKGEKTKELARVFNISHTAVKRYLQLLKLAPELQMYADNENVPYTNLISLTNLDHEEQMEVYRNLKSTYSGVENVFLSASNIVIEQNVRSVQDKNAPSPAKMPTAEQVINRTMIAEEEDDNEEYEAPHVPQSPSYSYEDMVGAEFNRSFEDEMQNARVIDMQLTVILKNMRELFDTEYKISDEVKSNAIEQLTAILNELKQ